jgi:hypothetical protein
LNHAREITERIIDNLHKQAASNTQKPRTYRDVARRAYLKYAKARKPAYIQIRFAIRRQLQYVRRNLDTIGKQMEQGASLCALSDELYKKLLVISELYNQQKMMYDEKTHSIPDRIVSISQPHLRPVVIPFPI